MPAFLSRLCAGGAAAARKRGRRDATLSRFDTVARAECAGRAPTSGVEAAAYPLHLAIHHESRGDCSMLTNSAPTRLASAISTMGLVVSTVTSTIEAVNSRAPGGTFLKRRAAHSVLSRLAWGAVPLIAGAACYWGVGAWRRRTARRELIHPVATLPMPDPPAPFNSIDESSWESFPASDPPAVSPGPAKPKAF